MLHFLRQAGAAISVAIALSPAGIVGTLAAQEADLILRGGQIVAADEAFNIHEAIAVVGGRILRVGSNDNVMQTTGPKTRVVELGGKMVLPGLIDSHTHPTGAAMTEFDHPIPVMETIADVLAYIREREKVTPPGQWIQLRQVFITRLKEQRYPTRKELDDAAPNHPVMFATGPDAVLNAAALKESGINRDTKVMDGGAGYIEKDPETGEPTGILRSCTRLAKFRGAGRTATDDDQIRRLLELFADYNSVGLTGIIDRNASAESMKLYRQLLDSGRLRLRVGLSRAVATDGPVEAIQEKIKSIANEPLRRGGAMLRIVGIKTFLDGGMLTGSAYMRQPWGVSDIYSITDPNYRGLLFISRDRLLPIVRTTVESEMQFTAHSVGDGAVHTLLDVYEEINRTTPVAKTRPCLTHSNFMSAEAVEQAARLGVVVDIQPAWLYLDGRTLSKQFGLDRLRYFQPLASMFKAGAIVGGGSDHMQKIGSFRSVNPYNPFLGMWIAITRTAKGAEAPIHSEEALTRQQAIQFYTINNAHLLFLEKETGSLEVGKLADMIVIDRDLLACPVDDIPKTTVLTTYLAGKPVYERPAP